MNTLEQDFIEKLKLLDGKSAPIITNGLKNFDGVEYDSMLAAIINMIQEMQIDKIKAIKKVLVGSGITLTAAVAIIGAISAIVFKKEKKKNDERIEEIICKYQLKQCIPEADGQVSNLETDDKAIGDKDNG